MIEFLRNVGLAIVGVITSILMVFTNTPLTITKDVATTTNPSNEEIILEVKEETTKIVDEEVTQPKKLEKEPETTEIIVEEEADVITIESDSEFVDLVVTIPPVVESTLSSSEINLKARASLVNIICTTKQGGILQPITGSGMIMDKRGVIVTNAHIAQYYLLKDYITEGFLDCTIRTGSPAINTYKAELLFISPSWVKENYQKIALSNPKGTGENDFALLLINDVTKPGETLPTEFPYVAPDIRGVKPEIRDSVIVAGYPAGFLGSTAIQKDLYAVTTFTEVMDVFTFIESTLDLFSIGGSIAAQKGSSGGGVISTEGRLLGVVVTASDATQTDDRDLRAITLSHINNSLKRDTGVDLNDYLFGDLSGKARQFDEILSPTLTALLESALNN